MKFVGPLTRRTIGHVRLVICRTIEYVGLVTFRTMDHVGLVTSQTIGHVGLAKPVLPPPFSVNYVI